MKNLRKIIAFFLIIFFTGIYITFNSVKKTLNKETTHEKTVDIKKDTSYLLKSEKKIKTV